MEPQEEWPDVPAEMGLSPRQRVCLDAIRAHEARTGVMPSLEELREVLGLGSKSGVLRLLQQLEDRGRIARLPHRRRAIRIVTSGPCPCCAACARTREEATR